MQKTIKELRDEGYLPVYSVRKAVWESLDAQGREIIIDRYLIPEACRQQFRGDVFIYENNEDTVIFFVR